MIYLKQSDSGPARADTDEQRNADDADASQRGSAQIVHPQSLSLPTSAFIPPQRKECGWRDVFVKRHISQENEAKDAKS